MSKDGKNNLKLIGKNPEDLKVISAYSQDSIVLIKDMIFLNFTFPSTRLIPIILVYMCQNKFLPQGYSTLSVLGFLLMPLKKLLP